MKGTKFICLTPVKNEAWILPMFLELASMWADHIIIVDQCSTDGSRKIARSHPKVILIENNNPEYDEEYRQRLLIGAARNIEAHKRILIALDADEALTSNWYKSKDWQKIQNADPGTVLGFNWLNLIPKNKEYCIPVTNKPYGYIDDGSNHKGETIHSNRIPMPKNSQKISLGEIGVLHFQLLAENRAMKKKCWYQCWELFNNTDKDNVFRCRYYNRYIFDKKNLSRLKNEWVEDFYRKGIDVFNVDDTSLTWWDKEIIEMFLKKGHESFKKCDIWDVDWQDVAERLEYNDKLPVLVDPRNKFDKIVHRWLRKTQNTQNTIWNRIIQFFLKKIW